MKKIAILFVLLFVSIYCHAQNADLKYYFDSRQGFEGYSVAVYLDKNIEQEYFDFFNNKIAERLKPVTKLTKNNNWLFHKAMNEWDYENGEVYLVICTASRTTNEGILILALIKGKDDFIWHAYSVDSSNPQILDGLF